MTTLDDLDPLRHGNLDAPVDTPTDRAARLYRRTAGETWTPLGTVTDVDFTPDDDPEDFLLASFTVNPHLRPYLAVVESPLGPILTATIRPMATDTKRTTRDDGKTETTTRSIDDTRGEEKPKGAEPAGEPQAVTWAGSGTEDAIPLNTETHGNHARNTRADI